MTNEYDNWNSEETEDFLSKNVTETKTYKVLLTTDTKFVLDLEEKGGLLRSHNTYTKSLNFKTGDYISIPKEES